MPEIDVDGLRVVAEGAAVTTALAEATGGAPWNLDGWPKECVAHISAFDPPTVLALLDRLSAAEGAVKRVRVLGRGWTLVANGYVDPSDGPIWYARALRRCSRTVSAALDGSDAQPDADDLPGAQVGCETPSAASRDQTDGPR